MAGSPKYVYEYIKANKPELKGFYYLPFREKGIFQQISYIVRFAPVFLSAKFLVSSHAPYDFIPFSWSRRKVLINAWHGTPLKCMFFSDPGASDSELRAVLKSNKLTSIFLVSSSIEAGLITRCFHLDPRKIAYTGHPRNDILINGNKMNKLKGLFKLLPSYSKAILYCPTYRRDAPTRFFPFEDLDMLHLNRFLEENKLIIFTRGHIQNHGELSATKSDRIIELGQDVLQEINDILSEIDILITDYSSIYIDYLLLDRPCIFIPYDKEDYQKKVGFLFDDYDYWTPGMKVTRYEDFVDAIREAISENDMFKSKRAELKSLFHYHQAKNASEQIVKYISEYSSR